MIVFILSILISIITLILRVLYNILFVFPDYVVRVYRSSDEPFKQICSDLWTWYPVHITVIGACIIASAAYFLTPIVKENIHSRPDTTIESFMVDVYYRQIKGMDWRIKNFEKSIDWYEEHPKIRKIIIPDSRYNRWILKTIDRYAKHAARLELGKMRWELKVKEKQERIDRGEFELDYTLEKKYGDL